MCWTTVLHGSLNFFHDIGGHSTYAVVFFPSMFFSTEPLFQKSNASWYLPLGKRYSFQFFIQDATWHIVKWQLSKNYEKKVHRVVEGLRYSKEDPERLAKCIKFWGTFALTFMCSGRSITWHSKKTLSNSNCTGNYLWLPNLLLTDRSDFTANISCDTLWLPSHNIRLLIFGFVFQYTRRFLGG